MEFEGMMIDHLDGVTLEALDRGASDPSPWHSVLGDALVHVLFG